MRILLKNLGRDQDLVILLRPALRGQYQTSTAIVPDVTNNNGLIMRPHKRGEPVDVPDKMKSEGPSHK